MQRSLWSLFINQKIQIGLLKHATVSEIIQVSFTASLLRHSGTTDVMYMFKYHVLINRARGTNEEMFLLTSVVLDRRTCSERRKKCLPLFRACSRSMNTSSNSTSSYEVEDTENILGDSKFCYEYRMPLFLLWNLFENMAESSYKAFPLPLINANLLSTSFNTS